MPSKRSSSFAKSTRNENFRSSPSTGNGDGNGASANGPSHDQIAELARQIYQESGSVEGNDAQNWLKAEQILRDRANGRSVGAGPGLVSKPEA
jgi:hypothetical protein